MPFHRFDFCTKQLALIGCESRAGLLRGCRGDTAIAVTAGGQSDTGERFVQMARVGMKDGGAKQTGGGGDSVLIRKRQEKIVPNSNLKGAI